MVPSVVTPVQETADAPWIFEAGTTAGENPNVVPEREFAHVTAFAQAVSAVVIAKDCAVNVPVHVFVPTHLPQPVGSSYRIPEQYDPAPLQSGTQGAPVDVGAVHGGPQPIPLPVTGS